MQSHRAWITAVILLTAALLPTGSALTAKETALYEDILIWLQTKTYEREYRKNMRKAFILDLYLARQKPDPGIWNRENPAHRKRLAGFISGLSGQVTGDTVAFGDSLMDLTRSKLHSVPGPLNFSISGSWAHHMAQMARDIRPALERAGLYRSIRYVVVGSLGGNPLLARQPVKLTIERSIRALDTIRRLYPEARIIVFGIPPTISIYVNKNAPAFEKALYLWVLRDDNAVMLPLQRRFAGKLGLFPKAVMSVDGVHFSSRGAAEFDGLIEKAKQAPPKALID